MTHEMDDERIKEWKPLPCGEGRPRTMACVPYQSVRKDTIPDLTRRQSAGPTRGLSVLKRISEP